VREGAIHPLNGCCLNQRLEGATDPTELDEWLEWKEGQDGVGDDGRGQVEHERSTSRAPPPLVCLRLVQVASRSPLLEGLHVLPMVSQPSSLSPSVLLPLHLPLPQPHSELVRMTTCREQLGSDGHQ
jgi:hypothetical protein